MMGSQSPPQENLFYAGFSLDSRVRKDHPLRDVVKNVDFNFISAEVADMYGQNGNVSVPPPVILKLLFLLVSYNVRSERELMLTVPERLDWLWFLGYTLDSDIPNHSVLSKARRKWGVNVFRSFFERIVYQCVERGLVDGKKLFVDSSLMEANASKNSVVDTQSLKRHLNAKYVELEKRLDEPGMEGVANRRYVSTTDPDSGHTRKGKGGSRPCYKVHRGVDGAHEVITSTEVTSGEVDDSHRLESVMDAHQQNTGVKAETVVADSKYGTAENFLALHDRGVKAHMPDLKGTQIKDGLRRGKYADGHFAYDAQTDTYTCPDGKTLRRGGQPMEDNTVKYRASSRDCKDCGLRGKCTSGKIGRTVRRHVRHDEVEHMRAMSKRWASKRDIKTRQHVSEGSFARGGRHGLKRSRWRGLWRVEIQEYLIASVQNIFIMTHRAGRPRPLIALAAIQERLIPVKAVSGRCNAQETAETPFWERCGRIKNAITRSWRSIINQATPHLSMALGLNFA
jgi:transposase